MSSFILKMKKTIYEFTEIPLSDLPEEVRQEIAQGKQIATAEELYAFFRKLFELKSKIGKGRNDKSRKMAMDVIKEIVYNTDL